MSSIKIEFAVQMRKGDEAYAGALRSALDGVGQVEIDTQEGRVIVQTQRPWSEIHDKIEATGRKAVLSGFGGQSAVALINTTGSVVDRTPIQGVVRFTTITAQEPGVVVDGVVDGLTPGLHGFHIHESGDTSAGCSSVGEHYNPRQSPHGSPTSAATERHAGDLGNIRADESGRATFRFVDPVLEVWDIIGRAVVITDAPDDLGRGGHERSLVDGNSGERIACGIIARSAGILENFKRICACDGVTLWDERNKPLAGKERSQKL
ncbi:copper chaperone for superoxide dismutase isoform X1 [Drosophila elegans]|uniref:copper chaperone for superoxide dismutase isoform X1 n=2 Tax=Drosophila elegans TaxID=30023 RepID=UPI0007E67FA0|nr:copper chaperone for superoxide dismutase isoform X1 [Drosophila elegans]